MNVLYQQNLTSGMATKFFYAGALAVAQMAGSGVYYLHDDALGSVVMTTTPSATIAFSSEYTPYGGSYALVGVEALMYTGKLLDPTTGLYYEGARYYDPRTGRFITEDSVVGSTSDPMSLNRYVYARDNPMKVVDTNGHEWWNPVADFARAAPNVVGAAYRTANTHCACLLSIILNDANHRTSTLSGFSSLPVGGGGMYPIIIKPSSLNP